MNKAINPNPTRDNKLSYSQAILSEANMRVLHISGQIGADASGNMPESFDDQTRQTWENLLDVLREAGMGITDLVKVTAYLTNADDYAAYAKLRSDYLRDHKPASTLLVVAALAKPEWKVEIEAVAMAR